MFTKTKNLQLLLILVLILKILGMIYRIFSTRLLGLEGNRLVAIIMPSLSLALSASSLSISSVVNQEISLNFKTKRIRVRSIMLSAFKLIITSTSIVSIVLLLSFPIYKYLYKDSFIYFPMLLTIPLLYFSNTSGILKGYLESNNSFITAYLSNIVESVVKLLLTILLLIIFKSYNTYIKVIIIFFSLMASEMSSCLYLSLKIKRRFNLKINKEYQNIEKKLASHAIPLTIDSLITTLFSYLIPFVFYYAAAKNGIDFIEASTEYAKASCYSIPLLLLAEYFSYTVGKLTFPKITKIRDDKTNVVKIYNSLLAIIILTSGIMITLAYFHSDFILNLLYGKNAISKITRLVTPLYFTICFNPLSILILQVYDKEKRLLLITIIAQIINVILIILFTYLSLENGYIIGISIGMFIKSIILMCEALRLISFKPNKDIYYSIFLLILLIIINYFIPTLLVFIISASAYALLMALYFYCHYKNILFPRK